MKQTFSYQDIFEHKQNVLIVTAHPDDTLVYFGALIAQLRHDGKAVFVVVVTNGARGSMDNTISEEKLAALRVEEECAALESLLVTRENVICLNYLDGEVESDLKLIGEISRYIRKFKADIVCTHEPSLLYQHSYDHTGYFVQHRDHRKVGEATIDAVYPFSRDRSFFTEQYAEGLEPHAVYDLLLTDEMGSNFDFEYTENLEVKKQAMRLHASQFDEAKIGEIIEGVKEDGRYLEKFRYLKLLW